MSHNRRYGCIGHERFIFFQYKVSDETILRCTNTVQTRDMFHEIASIANQHLTEVNKVESNINTVMISMETHYIDA